MRRLTARLRQFASAIGMSLYVLYVLIVLVLLGLVALVLFQGLALVFGVVVLLSPIPAWLWTIAGVFQRITGNEPHPDLGERLVLSAVVTFLWWGFVTRILSPSY